MAIGYIIGAVPLIVDVADFPAEEDVEVGITYDNETKTGTYLGLTGNNLTAVLEKSVSLVGVLSS